MFPENQTNRYRTLCKCELHHMQLINPLTIKHTKCYVNNTPRGQSVFYVLINWYYCFAFSKPKVRSEKDRLRKKKEWTKQDALYVTLDWNSGPNVSERSAGLWNSSTTRKTVMTKTVSGTREILRNNVMDSLTCL